MAQNSIYTYRTNPYLSRSYQIMRHSVEKGDGAESYPIGDYTVLDWEEDPALTERKVMNLVTLLNGSAEIMDLREQADGRLLFHKKAKQEGESGQEFIFYNYKGNGVSQENALLTFQEEVIHE